jgi:protoporphyrinogen oxidase
MPTPGAKSPAPVAILGAGLTGLAAADTLARAGIKHRLFEKLGHVGGHAVTTEEGGYRFDRTGHALHLRDPEIRAAVDSWLGSELLTVQRRSGIWSHGVYTRYPFQANTFNLPAAVAYECVLGFIEAHFNRSSVEPADFEQFCLQQFGPGFSRHFMLPYNCRMWGVHPREITTAWCQRFVPRPALEDVVAGALGLPDRRLGYNATFLYPRRGIGQLAEAMTKGLPSIELCCAPRSIEYRARRLHFDAGVVDYRVLISSLPLPTLVELLDDPPPEVRSAARALRCTHLYYLDLALHEPSRQPYHWVYVPEERYPFYRVGCYSHFSAEMAPPGKASLYVELVDREEPNLQQLLPRVLSSLEQMELIGGPGSVAFVRVRRLAPAYVVYDHAYAHALSAILPFLEASHIISTGRYGGWDYSSMEDALIYGRDAARRAEQLLA